MEKGYSLKRNAIRRWMYGRKIDPLLVSNRLHLRVSVFKRMLKEKAEFNESQIRRLVYFMGARSAFNVIYYARNAPQVSSKKFLNGFDKRFIREMFYVPCNKQGVAMFRNLIKFFIGRVCKRYIRNRRHDIQRMRADKLQDNIDLVWLKAELGAMQNRLVFREDTLVNAKLQFPAQKPPENLCGFAGRGQ